MYSLLPNALKLYRQTLDRGGLMMPCHNAVAKGKEEDASVPLKL
jgi:hypothetical protein